MSLQWVLDIDIEEESNLGYLDLLKSRIKEALEDLTLGPEVTSFTLSGTIPEPQEGGKP